VTGLGSKFEMKRGEDRAHRGGGVCLTDNSHIHHRPFFSLTGHVEPKDYNCEDTAHLYFTLENDGSFGLHFKKSPCRTFISKIQVKNSILCLKVDEWKWMRN
jgi:hypothetical protein